MGYKKSDHLINIVAGGSSGALPRGGQQARARPCLSLLGQDALEQGDVIRAYGLLSQCHLLNQEAGNRRNIARSLFLLASVCALQGNIGRAHFLYKQSLTQALEHPRLVAPCLEGLAAVATA